MSYVSLTPVDLAIAALLLVLTGAISVAFRLGLERSLAVSAARMCLQLGVVAGRQRLELGEALDAHLAEHGAVLVERVAGQIETDGLELLRQPIERAR